MGIKIPIVTEFDSKGIDKAIKEFKSLEGAGAKAHFALQKAALPAAAALAAVAGAATFAVKAAIADAAAQEQLAGVLIRSTGATTDAIKENEKFISSLSRQTATADDELRPALASLVTATKDVALSQELLATAQDVAAATGADLSTTVDALSKAYNGNMKGLKALDPSLMAAIKSGASFDEVMATLAKTTGGAATDAANTAAGKMKGLSIAFDETKESIGAALLPVLEALIPVLQTVADFAQEHTTLFLILGGVIAGVATAVLAYNAYLKISKVVMAAAAAAQWLWNAAMTANPIGLIVVGVAALIAGFILLEKRFGIISKVFNNWKDLLWIVLGPLGLLIKGIEMAIDLIGKLDVGNLVSKIPGAGVVGNVAGGVGGVIKGIGGIFGAEGGIVTRPTLATIGEAGPEMVIPLHRAPGASALGGMGTTINNYYNYSIPISTMTADEKLPRFLVDQLKTFNRTIGPTGIKN